jgi:elongator complex protein 3
MRDYEKWTKRYQITPERLELARNILEDIRKGKNVASAVSAHPIPTGGYLPKSILVAEYKRQIENGEAQEDPMLVERIRMKPVRSLSGVTTVTFLTKPYPCPGKCIFCPDDVRMPKSYLIDEPGAARAYQHSFDPYLQVNHAWIPTKPMVTQLIKSSFSFWVAPGALIVGIIRNTSLNAVSMP